MLQATVQTDPAHCCSYCQYGLQNHGMVLMLSRASKILSTFQTRVTLSTSIALSTHSGSLLHSILPNTSPLATSYPHIVRLQAGCHTV